MEAEIILFNEKYLVRLRKNHWWSGWKYLSYDYWGGSAAKFDTQEKAIEALDYYLKLKKDNGIVVWRKKIL